MAVSKRNVRTYKIKDVYYRKAAKRARGSKMSLSTLIENWVTMYSEGYSVGLISTSSNQIK